MQWNGTGKLGKQTSSSTQVFYLNNYLIEMNWYLDRRLPSDSDISSDSFLSTVWSTELSSSLSMNSVLIISGTDIVLLVVDVVCDVNIFRLETRSGSGSGSRRKSVLSLTMTTSGREWFGSDIVWQCRDEKLVDEVL